MHKKAGWIATADIDYLTPCYRFITKITSGFFLVSCDTIIYYNELIENFKFDESEL